LQVTNAKVAADLSAGKISTGTLDASIVNVINLSATNITAGSMSGTRLADGTVADIKISGIAASKITAGTISASISLTSPSLTITAGGTTVNIDATNYVRLSTPLGTSTIVALEPAGVSVRDSVGSARSDLTKGSLSLVSPAGAAGVYGSGSVILSGNQIITTRQAAVTNPTGGGTIDVQCRAALVDLLNRVRAHGLIS
jgi:hypothetical protein